MKYNPETTKWYQLIATLDNVPTLIENFVKYNHPESYDVVGIVPQLSAPGCILIIAYTVKEEKKRIE